MGVYPVDYPATTDFPTAMDGIGDASAHVESDGGGTVPTPTWCSADSPEGAAAAMGFVTANVIPDGAPEGVPNPMPPDVARPCRRGRPVRKTKRPVYASDLISRRSTVGPLYAAKTIDLCVPDDLVCSRPLS